MALSTYSCPECRAILGRKGPEHLCPDLLPCPQCGGTQAAKDAEYPKGQYGETWLWRPGQKMWTITRHPGVQIISA